MAGVLLRSAARAGNDAIEESRKRELENAVALLNSTTQQLDDHLRNLSPELRAQKVMELQQAPSMALEPAPSLVAPFTQEVLRLRKDLQERNSAIVEMTETARATGKEAVRQMAWDLEVKDRIIDDMAEQIAGLAERASGEELENTKEAQILRLREDLAAMQTRNETIKEELEQSTQECRLLDQRIRSVTRLHAQGEQLVAQRHQECSEYDKRIKEQQQHLDFYIGLLDKGSQPDTKVGTADDDGGSGKWERNMASLARYLQRCLVQKDSQYRNFTCSVAAQQRDFQAQLAKEVLQRTPVPQHSAAELTRLRKEVEVKDSVMERLALRNEALEEAISRAKEARQTKSKAKKKQPVQAELGDVKQKAVEQEVLTASLAKLDHLQQELARSRRMHRADVQGLCKEIAALKSGMIPEDSYLHRLEAENRISY